MKLQATMNQKAKLTFFLDLHLRFAAGNKKFFIRNAFDVKGLKTTWPCLNPTLYTKYAPHKNNPII